MNILEGRCFLVSNSGVFLMIILIFGLISVSQVSAETQGQDATPAPPNAKSSSKNGKGVERYGPQGSYRPEETSGFPYWATVLIVIIIVAVVIGCFVGLCIRKNKRQNQQTTVNNAPPQGEGEITAAPPGHQYNGQDQMPMAAAPPGYQYNGQGQMPMAPPGYQYYGQGQMPMAPPGYQYYGQGQMPMAPPGYQYYGQGQMPMASPPQNGVPYGQVEKAPV